MTARAWASSLALVLVAACTGSPIATGPPSTSNLTASPGPSPSATTAPPGSPVPGSVEAVRADLERYVETVERSHHSLFEYVPETDWRAAVERLDALIQELVPDQPERLMVEFMRLHALPGVVGGRHGHAGARPTTDRPALAIATYTFADGIYITRALPDQQDIVGGRITAVAGRPIDEVVELIEPLISRDNEWTPEVWFIDSLRLPDVLVGVGLIDAVGPVEITVELAGETSRSAVVPLLRPSDHLEPPAPPLSWISEVDPLGVALHVLPQRPDALWTSRMGEPLWWTTLDEGSTLFVQQIMVEPPTSDQLAAILVAASEPGVQRVIFDVRHNLGGNDSTSTIRTFQQPAIDQPGRLFVLTSTNVFSAATFIADELDQFSEAILVGEPTGGSPEALGGDIELTLSGLPIPLSVGIPRTSGAASDRPLTVMPDILVPLTGADYFSDRDAALESVQSHEP